MPDVSSLWAGDIQVSASGDLLLIDGDDRAQQRIIRRLFTVAGAYLFHLDYGASVPERVGNVIDPLLIQSVVYSQLLVENSISQNPPPSVIVVPILNGVNVTINYISIEDGQQKQMVFDYPPSP